MPEYMNVVTDSDNEEKLYKSQVLVRKIIIGNTLKRKWNDLVLLQQGASVFCEHDFV